MYDDLDLPEAAWSENDKSEPERKTPRVNGVPWYWWCVGAVLVAFLVGGLVGLL